MADYWHVLFFSLIGGIVSLIGGLLLLSRKNSAQTLAKYATPFAAGALLGAAFFDLVPEAFSTLEVEEASVWVLGGIIAFFLLEHFLHWFHHHHDHEDTVTPAPLVIIGDSIHNLLDGVAIGAAFLIDVPTGVVASIAVAAHEIPQEIGDFGLLLKFGYGRKKVILINVISALLATVGALLTFWLGYKYVLPTNILLAITAGMFIYIAASDLIPTIHEESKRRMGTLAPLLLVSGVLVVALVTSLAHNYNDAESGICATATYPVSDSSTHACFEETYKTDDHKMEYGHTQEEHDAACDRWAGHEFSASEGISADEATCHDVLE